jgi:hypothetical protein
MMQVKNQQEQNVHNIEPQIMEMVQTMEEIYRKNMAWLEENENALYAKMDKITQKIIKDKSKEKFRVELTDGGSLDILDLKNSAFIYNREPFEYGDSKVKELEDKNYKRVVFKGSLLGTHITSIVKTLKPKKIVVCEPNKQIFSCSLYVTDYAELAKISKIKFSIKDECKVKESDIVVELNDLQ